MDPTDTGFVRDEFDRLAVFAGNPSPHSHLYRFLLDHMPPRASRALDIGCGAGDLTRFLAGQVAHTVGIDLSSRMIDMARERVCASNIEWRTGDFLAMDLEPASCDFVVSAATLHHLPLEPALARIRSILRPGGVLAFLDLFEPSGAVEFFESVISLFTRPIRSLICRGELRMSRAECLAWEEHARHDRYLTTCEARHRIPAALPGAIVTRHLEWRYSVIWGKPQ